jgi:hypothetical protein
LATGIGVERVIGEFFEAGRVRQPGPEQAYCFVGQRLSFRRGFVSGEKLVLSQRKKTSTGEHRNRQKDEHTLSQEAGRLLARSARHLSI